MVYPYFADSVLSLTAIGALIGAGLIVTIRLGW